MNSINGSKKPIPEEVAIEICREIRKQNNKISLSLAKYQCRCCMMASKDKDVGICVYGAEDHRGCQLVNRVFDMKEK